MTQLYALLIYTMHACLIKPLFTHADTVWFMKMFYLFFREGDFGAVTSEGTRYSSTIRSSSCELLTPRKLNCIKCKNYSYALAKRKKRLDDRIIHPRKFSHSSFKHSDMTRDELCLKLKEQKGEISDLTNTVWKLKRQYENSIRKEGVSVKEHESLELSS